MEVEPTCKLYVTLVTLSLISTLAQSACVYFDIPLYSYMYCKHSIASPFKMKT